MECSTSCCLDERSLVAKFDLMVERFRSWIDDVEYKIKDAIENRKSMLERFYFVTFRHIINFIHLQFESNFEGC